jgi:hypothetical protein
MFWRRTRWPLCTASWAFSISWLQHMKNGLQAVARKLVKWFSIFINRVFFIGSTLDPILRLLNLHLQHQRCSRLERFFKLVGRKSRAVVTGVRRIGSRPLFKNIPDFFPLFLSNKRSLAIKHRLIQFLKISQSTFFAHWHRTLALNGWPIINRKFR